MSSYEYSSRNQAPPGGLQTTIKRSIYHILLTLALTLFILYPLFHEFGHALSVWLLGGEVIRITIYPGICTECLIPPENLLSIVMTGFAGILFPMLLSLLIPCRWLIPSVVTLALRMMVILDAAGELFATVRTILGHPIATSDLSVVILETGIDPYFILIFSGTLLILSLLFLLLTDPAPILEALFGPPAPQPDPTPSTGSSAYYNGYYYHHG